MASTPSTSVRVTLPGGIVLDDGRRVRHAALREFSGVDEDWLSGHPDAPNAFVITRLLSATLESLDDARVDGDVVRRMLVGDRDYLMLALRRFTLGDVMSAVSICPACGERMNVDVPLAGIIVQSKSQLSETYEVALDDRIDRGRTARFRLPTGADQEAVHGLEPKAAVSMLLARCVLVPDASTLSGEDERRIAGAMETYAPDVDVELALTCPSCEKACSVPFDPTAFFLDEMRAQSRHLLAEIHNLAFYYHWREADIMGMSRSRRRAYLSLLADTLQRD